VDLARQGLPGAEAVWALTIRQARHVLSPLRGRQMADDYFQADWQKAFWGSNYSRLAAVKRKYDPDGLFFVHHGVGSEAWSGDGFTRV
jgi:hypothetical protein